MSNCDPSESDSPQGGCGGNVEATLSGLYPWAGAALSERLSVWAAAGYGAGRLTLRPDGSSALTTNLGMSMGAAGLRSDVLKPADGDGFAMALKGDARFTSTRSEAVTGATGNLMAAKANIYIWLVRAGIEGSRPVGLGDGVSATPSFEIGLRIDGGDAERGAGADMGGGLSFADPANGVSFDFRARGLVVHEVSGFREWGASAAFAWDPRPGTDQGPSLSLARSWDASPSGGMDALLTRATLAGLAANDDGSEAGEVQAAGRLQGEIGYGVALFGGDFTGSPAHRTSDSGSRTTVHGTSVSAGG